jgi:vitamin B12 transporter
MSRFCSVFARLCFSILALCISLTAFAEEPAPQVLEEVVVTATKTPVPVSQLTSAVEVIKGEELEQKKIKMVADALRIAQGVTVTSSGGPGTLTTARIRGAESTHTLVMIDGTVVNSPTTGLFDFANLTTDNIERIEILRGAQSMLWGSDAMGGVINIITKKGTGTPTASAFLEYGSFTTLREGAQVSGTKGPFDLSASVSQWDSSSFSAINYKRGATERDGFHNYQASSRLGVTLPKDGRLEVNMRWWKTHVDFDGFDGITGAPVDVFGAKTTDHTLILSASYEQPITSWWSQKLTLARGQERAFSTSGLVQRDLGTGLIGPVLFPFTSDINTRNQRLEWQHNFQVGKPLLVTAGYQFREDLADSPTFGTGTETKLISSNAGFAQAQVNMLERIFLTGGVRQDSYNVFGDATTYRATAGYLLKETGTKFRGSYATGFRAPTINFLFFPGFSNPNLKPEKSRSMDVGVDQKLLQDKLLVSAGYFWNRFRNLIQSPPPTFLPQNVGNAGTKGWEAGFQYAVFKNLDLRGQYTWTLTRNLDNGLRLAQRPVDQASAGLSYQPFDPLRVNVDYRFFGGRVNDVNNTQKMPSFDVVNVSATYDVTKQWQIFGRVDNLFNKDYEEVLFFGTPIRSVFAGVKFTY